MRLFTKQDASRIQKAGQMLGLILPDCHAFGEGIADIFTLLVERLIAAENEIVMMKNESGAEPMTLGPTIKAEKPGD